MSFRRAKVADDTAGRSRCTRKLEGYFFSTKVPHQSRALPIHRESAALTAEVESVGVAVVAGLEC